MTLEGQEISMMDLLTIHRKVLYIIDNLTYVPSVDLKKTWLNQILNRSTRTQHQ